MNNEKREAAVKDDSNSQSESNQSVDALGNRKKPARMDTSAALVKRAAKLGTRRLDLVVFRTTPEIDGWFNSPHGQDPAEHELWELVAYHSKLFPYSMGNTAEEALLNLDRCRDSLGEHPDWPLSGYLNNLDQACRYEFRYAAPCHGADVRRRIVKTSEFRFWAREVRLPVIDDWRIYPGWPWGGHTTHNLELLAYAGELWRYKFNGGEYDEADIATAPTREAIVRWVRELVPDTSTRVCEAIATLLRPDNLSLGRRPSSKKRKRKTGKPLR